MNIRSVVTFFFAAALCTAGGLPSFYRQISRVIWVVHDADSVVKAWTGFGLSDIRDRGRTVLPERDRNRERTTTVRLITARLGTLTIDFVQPGEARDPFAAFLSLHGDGIFAIVHPVPDQPTLSDEVQRMNRACVGVLFTVTLQPETAPLAFFDTGLRGKYILGLEQAP